jgi:hypothetical protein
MSDLPFPLRRHAERTADGVIRFERHLPYPIRVWGDHGSGVGGLVAAVRRGYHGRSPRGWPDGVRRPW